MFKLQVFLKSFAAFPPPPNKKYLPTPALLGNLRLQREAFVISIS
jgi:hypothetical protein